MWIEKRIFSSLTRSQTIFPLFSWAMLQDKMNVENWNKQNMLVACHNSCRFKTLFHCLFIRLRLLPTHSNIPSNFYPSDPLNVFWTRVHTQHPSNVAFHLCYIWDNSWLHTGDETVIHFRDMSPATNGGSLARVIYEWWQSTESKFYYVFTVDFSGLYTVIYTAFSHLTNWITPGLYCWIKFRV